MNDCQNLEVERKYKDVSIFIFTTQKRFFSYQFHLFTAWERSELILYSTLGVEIGRQAE